ncbi:A-kinase anchor protein 1, mitochondrial isoform X1 [Pelobates fuscus]|uniref:A-kinase anchor protein 1, mitochondrial isoform X1 n=1 Tax=Pelobates fuscus TaxID=191477 RepID=UPI002FE4509B
MSSFSLSKILPIIVPAAVAIGCWWYYSRKKKLNQSKPEPVACPADSAHIDAFVPIEVVKNARTLPLQEGIETRQRSLCSDSSSKHNTAILISDVKGSSRDILQNESKVQNGEICPLRQTTNCEDVPAPLATQLFKPQGEKLTEGCLESEDLFLNGLCAEYCVSHTTQTFLTENTKLPTDQLSKTDDRQAELDTDNIQETLTKTPRHMDSFVLECSSEKLSQAEGVQKPVLLQVSLIESSLMENQNSSLVLKDSWIKESFCAVDNNTQHSTVCVLRAEMDTEASLGAEDIEKGTNSDRLKMASCPDLEIFHGCSDDASTKKFFGNYEAKMVEELAINIISKVIVAAKQELLASAVRDLSDGDYLETDESASEKSMPLVLEQNGAISHEEGDSFSTRDSACESTQTEQNQEDDLTNVDNDQACLEESNADMMQRDFECAEEREPIFSPVHLSTDSFDEAHVAIDDSSMSACTSEDGVGTEDPMQSTVLSSLGIGSYDSLSTSGIELSRDQISVRKKKVKKDKIARKHFLIPNGHSNSSSLDLKGEGASTSETEIDHSGGSEMNGVDSADGASTLGSSEQLLRSTPKNLPLVVWEFEVPKHLVGRLIGKQGRFVTYLKETSGAKIYITTLPFTQEFQLCHIEGSQEAVDIALDLISKKFRDLDLTNFYQPPLLQRQGSLPTTSWLVLPEGVTIEVVVSSIASATHLFIQQHTHPTYHALSTLDQQMYYCYMEPGIPTLPTPVEVGTICAAPNENNEWWRAQVVSYFPNTEEVFIRYVDYGGYKRVKIKTLRQIRSDFVTLPFQGTEVLLDNVAPIHGDNTFTTEAIEAIGEMLNGVPLYAQVTNYDLATKIQMIQLWAMVGGEAVSINSLIVERGYARWQDTY